jgi:integrase
MGRATIVQCSLRTSDPALAQYYAAVLDREVMQSEHDKEERVVKHVRKRLFQDSDAKSVLKPVFKNLTVKQRVDPRSLIKIGDVVIDYNNDNDKESKVAAELLSKFPSLLSGGGNGPTDNNVRLSISGVMRLFLDYRKTYRNWSEGTYENNLDYLKRYRSYVDCEYLDQIDRVKHRNYGQWLLKNIAASTVNQELSTINAWVKYLRNQDIFELPEIETVPSSVIKKQKKERVTFRPQHVPDICSALEYLTVQQRLIIALCFVTGARVGEIGQLLAADVKTEGNITYVDIVNEDEDDDEFEEFKEKRKTVKNLNSKRLIPLPDALAEHVVALCNTAKRKGQKQLFFAVNDDVSGGRGGNASRTFLRRLREAGYGSEYVTHSARYMFKQVAHAGGMDEAWTEKVMGHASQRTGRSVYLSADLSKMKEIVDFVTNKHLLQLADVLNKRQKRKKYTRKTNTKSDS